MVLYSKNKQKYKTIEVNIYKMKQYRLMVVTYKLGPFNLYVHESSHRKTLVVSGRTIDITCSRLER